MPGTEISKERIKAASQKVKEREYWLNQLAGEWQKAAFYYLHPDAKGSQSFERHTFDFYFTGEDFSGLMRLRNGSDHRLFMILLAQLVLLLYKYTGSTDIIVGAPIYRQEVEGNFINTLLTLRNTVEPGMTFKQLLIQVRQLLVEATQHQNYPIEALLHKLDLPPSPEHGHDFPLFDITILLENVHNKSYIDHIRTNMSFRFRRRDQEVAGTVEYNPARYHAAAVEQIARHYQYLVHRMMVSLNSRLVDIEILSHEEKKQLLYDFNDTVGQYTPDKTIHRLFQQQVQQTADEIAVIGPPRVKYGTYMTDMTYISYRDLNEKSNQLARRLREKGMKQDNFAALMMERSVEMIIAALAILKADGAYLPIDPNYPEQRKKYMLTDSGVGLLLTDLDKGGLAYIPAGIEIMAVDSPGFYCGNGENLPSKAKDSDLVYLVYTSGSTGKPKGVMLEHRNVVNLIHFDLHHTNLDFSKVLQFHTIGFDASFHEIFCALLSGGELVLIDEDTRLDIPALFKMVEKNGIPTLFLPMSFLRIIFNDESYARRFPGGVKHIQTAGEQVVINHRFRRFLQENHVYFHNHYGPAETHVVTTLTLDPTRDIPELPAIGKPILNTQIYILDKEKQILPVGVPGELYIGGIQVGRGYLNRPQLTAERFVLAHSSWLIADRKATVGALKSPMSYQLSTMSYIYQTGDLARWLSDGNIEFLGRVDTQVKVRGFRVEPGEIESRLMDIDYIKEAVVITNRDQSGETFLCAYVVSDNEINAAELRDRLAKTLPDYMVPGYYVQVESIPLSPNGKVKREALPPIEGAAVKRVYAAPRNEMEKKLCQLWWEVLGLDKDTIGIDDNFFELGGHSLKATILIGKIYKTFGVKLILGELFNQPTVKGLAVLIKDKVPGIFIAIDPTEKKEYYPMSSAQKRMYIINQLEKKSISYNMPSPMILQGDLKKEKFAAVFRELIRRQEGLRTRFITISGEPVQRIHDEVSFTIEYHNFATEGTGNTKGKNYKQITNKSEGVIPHEKSPLEAKELNTHEVQVPKSQEPRAKSYIKDFVRPFDLSQAPLFRAGVLRLEEERYLFIVDFHHIIGDGGSIGILITEFTQIYESNMLSPLRIQYRDYAKWQKRLAASGELKRQEEYWIKQLDVDIPPLNLPLDYSRPDMMSFEGRWLEFEISPKSKAKLKKLAEQADATLYMVLLAAYNILLHKYTGQETIVVGSAIAGRSYADLEHIIGVFLNTLAVKNNPSDGLTFIGFLEHVKENALQAYENQDTGFEELVEKLELKRDYSRNPIFDTMLNFINMDIPSIKLSDLELSAYKMESSAVKLDIKINIWEQDQGLRCSLDYATKLFNQDTMETFIKNFLKIIDTIVENPGIKLADIQLISEEEKKELIDDFSEELQYEF
ncbi:MAG: amino acid adenylation domain-containing protein [Candidatus Aminicenantes bacterium]